MTIYYKISLFEINYLKDNLTSQYCYVSLTYKKKHINFWHRNM